MSMILDFRPDKSQPLPPTGIRAKAYSIFQKNQLYERSPSIHASGVLEKGTLRIDLSSITAHPGTSTTLAVHYQDREVMKIVYFNGMERELHNYVPGKEWEKLFMTL